MVSTGKGIHQTRESRDHRHAPWLDVAPGLPSITGIEHPCIIHNVEKGVQTLGGPSKLAKVRGELRGVLFPELNVD